MSLDAEFQSFHARHPHVYNYVCHYAQQAISKGYKRFAIATIWERIRWEVLMVSDDEFKMPNNHRAYYARMWMDDHPDYPDFFRTAELRSQTNTRVDRYGQVA